MIPNLPELAEFAANLPAKLDKDERRIRMFVADLPSVALRLAVTQPLSLPAFLNESGVVVATFIKAGNPRKWSLGSIFGKDPFARARDDARAFARRWQMSPLLIKELG